MKLIELKHPGRKTIISHETAVEEIEFSSDNQHLALIGEKTFQLVKLSTKRSNIVAHETPLRNHGAEINDTAFSSNSKYFATASKDGTAKLVELHSGNEIVISHEGEVEDITFSSDSKYFATASKGGTAKLVELRSGNEIVISHEGEVEDITFSSDSKYFATASKDGTTKLVELRSGNEFILISHENAVSGVEFRPDGLYLATKTQNHVRLNLLDTEKLIQITCKRLSQNLSLYLWQRYVGDEPYQKTCGNLPIHPSFLQEGRKLAKEGKISEAAKIFNRAKKLENTYNNRGRIITTGIDLNPDTETVDQNPRKVANKLYAPTKLEEGIVLANSDKITEAISAFKQVQKLDPELKIKAESWRIFCRNGSLLRQAKKVMTACNNAVEIASDNSELNQTNQAKYYDSRGLALALTGKYNEAIDDFQFYVKNSKDGEKSLALRKAWIETLKKGENPFTDEVLEELKNE